MCGLLQHQWNQCSLGSGTQGTSCMKSQVTAVLQAQVQPGARGQGTLDEMTPEKGTNRLLLH